MSLGKTVRDIVQSIPCEVAFDVHTVVEKLLQEHDEIYLANIGHYGSAAQYHAKISSVIAQNADLADQIGNSYSKNIHDKFSECHLFRRKKHHHAEEQAPIAV
ncbi:MAG: hypothetical protein LBG93_10335 [Treponema sp.]|jgi:hypothetical protein|nr:hypothetical protein [Treponema sp.]